MTRKDYNGVENEAVSLIEQEAALGRRAAMKDGFRIYDSDTHVLPAAEIIERYVDPDFRPRLAELAQYRVPIRQSAEHSGDGMHGYRIAPQLYRRLLGEAAPREG